VFLQLKKCDKNIRTWNFLVQLEGSRTQNFRDQLGGSSRAKTNLKLNKAYVVLVGIEACNMVYEVEKSYSNQ